MVAKGGASATVPFWSEATTWQDAHHRRASFSPWVGSAGAAAAKLANARARHPPVPTIRVNIGMNKSCPHECDDRRSAMTLSRFFSLLLKGWPLPARQYFALSKGGRHLDSALSGRLASNPWTAATPGPIFRA